jgi:hypothetical protein
MMAFINADGIPVNESDEDLKRFIDDPYFIHYVGMLNPPRPGVADCIQMLEHMYFKPGTPQNDLLHVRIIEWMDITWVMVSIPIAEKHRMESMAQVNQLKIVSGVPVMLADGGVHKFPAANERVCTFENTPEHPIYGNRR